jgi:acetyl esterase/lipase
MELPLSCLLTVNELLQNFILIMKKSTLITVIICSILMNSCTMQKWQEEHLNSGRKQVLYRVHYGKYHRNVLDVALPKNRSKEKTPVVILIHGGAWVMGNKGYFSSFMKQCADSGFACATINYRYASGIFKVHHPDLPNDVLTAVNFISSKSDKWGVSDCRFGLAGHSAGAHLALTTSYMLNTDNKIKACASWAGPLNFIDPDQLDIKTAHGIFSVYVGTTLSNASDTIKYKNASPFWLVKKNCVPTLLIYGVHDIGVPYSNAERFKSKLDSLSVPNTLVTFEKSGHIWTGKSLKKAKLKTIEWFKAKL